jgi:hypothetical protein
MKKGFLCLSSLLVLFLVMGVYTAQAQDYAALTQLNGKWLKISGSLKGWTVPTTLVQNELDQVNATFLNNTYACVSYNPSDNDEAHLTIMDANGIQVGAGSIYFSGGTVDQWLAYLQLSLDSKGDYLANAGDTAVQSAALAKTKSGAAKGGSFNSLGMYATMANDDPRQYGYLGGKLKAKIVDKVPWGGTCSGYVEP